MKRILFVLFFFGLLASYQSAWAFDVSISHASAAPGQQATVTASFIGNTQGVLAVDAALQYDPSFLKLESVEKGSAVASLNISSNTALPGQAKVTLFGISPVSVEKGELLIFKFTVKKEARKGKTLVRFSNIEFSSDNTSIAAKTVTDGILTIIK